MKALLKTLTQGSRDWQMATQLDAKRLPAHIAVIMDGNGRWAKQRNYPRILGHKAGIDSVRAVCTCCALMGIEILTLYAFSVENWKRPRHEVEGLWRLLRFYLRRELATFQKNDIQVVAIGRLESLPQAVQQELRFVIEKTANNKGMRLNLAINYGGRTDILDAVNSIIENARAEGNLESLEITEEAISSHLYTAGLKDPDLLIRTSGEMRISNFLLWQIAYSELYVTETLWPDFGQTELLSSLLSYQERDRRFGGLSSNTLLPADTAALLGEEIELPLA
ncbi:MAG TPA: isoprenyl transferase [Bryobacteraceae bacterium]|jgi:undecaprenyl diphosphate synthase|nr:isoprenyl transferase [Bryobacteraceae bacterium]